MDKFIKLLNNLEKDKKINRQQKRTIRGQYIKGDREAAKLGLERLLRKQGMLNPKRSGVTHNGKRKVS